MTAFTPLASFGGGLLIGLAAVLLMAFHGRIAGMTGILAGLLPPVAADRAWRAAFVAGAVAAPLLITALRPQSIAFSSTTPMIWVAVSGLVVGIGAQIGAGCTSGHGICGIARLSPRSILATLVFMATAFATVFITRHLLGGP